MNTRHRAFTLVEMLVVIGILTILISLAVWGLSAINNNAGTSDTRLVLDNCRSMLEEYRVAAGYKALPQVVIDGPGSVGDGAPDRFNPNGQVAETNKVFRRLQAMPGNKDLWSKLPSQRVAKAPAQFPFPETPLILDGWGNPVIYVPAAGMNVVDENGRRILVKSPDEHPFFASAGADSSFRTGSDNLYSFEN